MTDEMIIAKLNNFFAKYDQNKKLQDMAKENGLEVKNTIQLTKDTRDALAVSIVALILAKREHDSRYTHLARVGLEHRQLKASIINDYKDRAMELIARSKNDDSVIQIAQIV